MHVDKLNGIGIQVPCTQLLIIIHIDKLSTMTFKLLVHNCLICNHLREAFTFR